MNMPRFSAIKMIQSPEPGQLKMVIQASSNNDLPKSVVDFAPEVGGGLMTKKPLTVTFEPKGNSVGFEWKAPDGRSCSVGLLLYTEAELDEGVKFVEKLPLAETVKARMLNYLHVGFVNTTRENLAQARIDMDNAVKASLKAQKRLTGFLA